VIAALRYEWVRITTIRSTRICLVLALVLAGGLAALISQPQYTNFDENGPVGPPVVQWWTAFEAPLAIAAVLASVVAAQTIGQEYRFGLIRLTLTAFPKRAQILTAKVVSVVLTGLVFALVSFLGSWIGVALRGYPTRPENAPDPADSTILERGVLFVVLWALSAFAIAGITRQTALGIAVPIVSGLIVEQILVSVLRDRADWLGDILPWSNAGRWALTPTPDVVQPDGSGSPPFHQLPVGWTSIWIFTAWVVLFLVVETVAFVRRDA
jgi:ABC-2 type transport system permease protein